MDPMDITELLNRMKGGDENARGELLRRVYSELRVLARQRLRRFQDDSIGATELVHEIYGRVIGRENLSCENRRHFFGLVAVAMQDFLIDRARRRKTKKHGGAVDIIRIEDAVVAAEEAPEEFLMLAQALSRLREADEIAAEIVRLRFFVGLSGEEIADILEVSPATVDRRWKYARAWLLDWMREGRA